MPLSKWKKKPNSSSSIFFNDFENDGYNRLHLLLLQNRVGNFNLINLSAYYRQARVQGGGARPGPPRNCKAKKKERSSEQILSYFTYILLLFSRKYHFLSYFLSCPPPLEKLKSKKKMAFRFWAPPPYEFLDTRLIVVPN